MLMRPETPNDREAITQVTLAAFTSATYTPYEHEIVEGLRASGALSLSLVAELDGQIVGHVAFSAVTIDGTATGWYGLGPVSVQPGLQKQGIGSALIQNGLAQLRECGARGCVVLGSPTYYQRFGFRSHPQLYYAGSPDPEHFMAIAFRGDIPAGQVEYHRAFTPSTEG